MYKVLEAVNKITKDQKNHSNENQHQREKENKIRVTMNGMQKKNRNIRNFMQH
jgi:hypothetical protein